MSVLEVYSPTIKRAFNIKRDRPICQGESTRLRPSDFEDIICLDFCHPPQGIHKGRTLDTQDTQTSISAPGSLSIDGETRSLALE